MKKVIGGKSYDTEKAQLLHNYSYGNPGDFDYWQESLYVTSKGAFLVLGEGGARSKYAKRVGQNSWGGGEDIKPVSKVEALRWLEEHDGAEVILEHFAGEIEEA